MKVSIVTTVYNTYELVRQLAESVISVLDKEYLDKFIIVDDFSSRDGKLHDYYDYLEEKYDYIKVVRFSQYRANVYYGLMKLEDKDDSIYCSPKCNLGPALAVQTGVEEVESDIVLIVDSDTFFMKKSTDLLIELVTHFYNHPQVMCIGQVLGLNSHVDYKFDRLYYSLLGNNYRNGTCGEVSPIAYACRMSGWKDHHIEQISYGPAVIAWNNTFYMMSIYQECYKTMNFPMFSQGYMFHVGGATAKVKMGHTKTKCVYGGRAGNCFKDFYCGFHIINMKEEEYRGYLGGLGGRPFDNIELIDEDRLITTLPLCNDREYKGFPTEEYKEQFFDPTHKFFRKPRLDRNIAEQLKFVDMQKVKRANYLEKAGEHIK